MPPGCMDVASNCCYHLLSLCLAVENNGIVHFHCSFVAMNHDVRKNVILHVQNILVSLNIINKTLNVALGEQDAATILPHYLNVVENTPPLPVNTPESFIAASMKTEESSSSLPGNETQMLDTACVVNKSSAGSSESSMAGSPDTESPVLVNEYVSIFQLTCI